MNYSLLHSLLTKLRPSFCAIRAGKKYCGGTRIWSIHCAGLKNNLLKSSQSMEDARIILSLSIDYKLKHCFASVDTTFFVEPGVL